MRIAIWFVFIFAWIGASIVCYFLLMWGGRLIASIGNLKGVIGKIVDGDTYVDQRTTLEGGKQDG